MARKLNRYQALIEKIFFDQFTGGATEFEFVREELERELPAYPGPQGGSGWRGTVAGDRVPRRPPRPASLNRSMTRRQVLRT